MLTEGGLDFGNAYTLEISTEQLEVCSDDEFEPNDNNDQSSSIQEGTYSALNSCNEDWYQIELQEEQELQVELQFVHQQGDLDMELYADDGTVILTSNTVTDVESITHTSTYQGLHYWRVLLRSDTGSTGNNYMMQVVLSEPPEIGDSASEDTAEPESQTPPTAPPIKEGCNTIGSFNIAFSIPLIVLAIVLRRDNEI